MLIVLSLHHRVIHPEPQNLYPCHDIPIDRTKPIKESISISGFSMINS